MYKLVAIDLDGTLVTDNKELTTKTVEVIKEASKKGVKIMISSGRAFYRLEKFIDALGLRKENQCTKKFRGRRSKGVNSIRKIIKITNYDICKRYTLCRKSTRGRRKK